MQENPEEAHEAIAQVSAASTIANAIDFQLFKESCNAFHTQAPEENVGKDVAKNLRADDRWMDR